VSLPAILSSLAEYLGDVLVNECGQPVPDRVLRYHGNLPADQCCDNGTLSVSWAEGHATDTFPVTAVNRLNDPCAAAPVFTLVARYMICWPVPEVDTGGVNVTPVQDQDYDAVAQRLEQVAEGVARALIRLECPAATQDSVAVGLVAGSVRGWLRFIDVTPILPSGGCAGVQWRVYASPTP
jgi:hypothetical protein